MTIRSPHPFIKKHTYTLLSDYLESRNVPKGSKAWTEVRKAILQACDDYRIKTAYYEKNGDLTFIDQGSGFLAVSCESCDNWLDANTHLFADLSSKDWESDDDVHVVPSVKKHMDDDKLTTPVMLKRIEELEHELRILKKRNENLKSQAPLHCCQLMKIAVKVQHRYWQDPTNPPKQSVIVAELEEKYALSRYAAEAVERVACPLNRDKSKKAKQR